MCICSCASCNRFVETTAVALTDGSVVYTLPDQEYVNNRVYCIKLGQALPDGTNSSSILRFSINGVLYSAIGKCGHFVYGDQIRGGCTYPFKALSDTVAFIFAGNGCLPRTGHAFTNINS